MTRDATAIVAALLIGACATGPDYKGADLSALTPAARSHAAAPSLRDPPR